MLLQLRTVAAILLSGSAAFLTAVAVAAESGCAGPIDYAGGVGAVWCAAATAPPSDALAPLLRALNDFADRTGSGELVMRSMVRDSNRVLGSLDRPAASAAADVRPDADAVAAWLAGEVARVASPDHLMREVVAWRKRYNDLFDRWLSLPGQNDDSETARRLVGRFRFGEAADVLDRIVAAQEHDDAALAALAAFRDAQTCDLMDRSAEAEVRYRQAHRLAPDDLDFVDGYAGFLVRDRRAGEAIDLVKAELGQADDPGLAADERDERKSRMLALLGDLDHAAGRDGDGAESLAAARKLQRRLAAASPAVFGPALARTIESLGDLHRAGGEDHDGREAEAAYRDAADIRRPLAAANPLAFEPDLAQALDKLGLVELRRGRLAQAQAAWLEAREIRLRLAAADPLAFGADLEQTLRRLESVSQRAERTADPIEDAHLAARDILRRLAADDPEYFEPDLATALDNLGVVYRDSHRPEPAEKAFAEALEIDRRIATTDPARHEPALARTLDDLGDLYAGQGDFERAGIHYRESIDLLKKYAATDSLLRTRRLLYLQDLARLYASSHDAAGRERVRGELAEYLERPDQDLVSR